MTFIVVDKELWILIRMHLKIKLILLTRLKALRMLVIRKYRWSRSWLWRWVIIGCPGTQGTVLCRSRVEGRCILIRVMGTRSLVFCRRLKWRSRTSCHTTLFRTFRRSVGAVCCTINQFKTSKNKTTFLQTAIAENKTEKQCTKSSSDNRRKSTMSSRYLIEREAATSEHNLN